MNRLAVNYLGGLPLVWDDIEYFLEANERVLTKTLIGLAGDRLNFIIKGVELIGDGQQIVVTEGYIMHKGKIWRVDQHAAPNPELVDYMALNLTETPDPDGTKQTTALNEVECYIQSRCTLIGGDLPIPSGTQIFDHPRLTDIVTGFYEDWVNLEVDPDDNNGFVTVTENIDTLQGTYKYKIVGKLCHVEMDLLVNLQNNYAPFSIVMPPVIPDNSGRHNYGVFMLTEDNSNARYITEVSKQTGNLIEFRRVGNDQLYDEVRAAISFSFAIK